MCTVIVIKDRYITPQGDFKTECSTYLIWSLKLTNHNLKLLQPAKEGPLFHERNLLNKQISNFLDTVTAQTKRGKENSLQNIKTCIRNKEENFDFVKK